MKSVRLVSILALLALLLSVAAASAIQTLKPMSPVLKQVLGGDQSQEMMRKIELVRQAGLSYAPELVVPLTSDFTCKDPEGLRILAGMLGFDANYALAFGNKDAFFKNREFARNNVTGHLPAAGKLENPPVPAKAMETLQTNPDDVEARKALAVAGEKTIARMIEAADEDPEVLDLLVDGLYGSTVEGLYVVCSLAMTSEVGPELVQVFNDQAERINRLLVPLKNAQDDKTLVTLLEVTERKGVLEPVMARIQQRKGNMTLADVQWILAQVTPEREKLAAACR